MCSLCVEDAVPGKKMCQAHLDYCSDKEKRYRERKEVHCRDIDCRTSYGRRREGRRGDIIETTCSFCLAAWLEQWLASAIERVRCEPQAGKLCMLWECDHCRPRRIRGAAMDIAKIRERQRTMKRKQKIAERGADEEDRDGARREEQVVDVFQAMMGEV